jgi:hypothetical protein
VRQTIGISTAVSAVIGIPISITLFPPAAIPVAIAIVIATAIVAWHLHRGGRALVRRSPKGTLTFILDSAHGSKALRRRS